MAKSKKSKNTIMQKVHQNKKWKKWKKKLDKPITWKAYAKISGFLLGAYTVILVLYFGITWIADKMRTKKAKKMMFAAQR